MTIHTRRNLTSLVKRNLLLKCGQRSGQCRKNGVKEVEGESKSSHWRGTLNSPDHRLGDHRLHVA